MNLPLNIISVISVISVRQKKLSLTLSLSLKKDVPDLSPIGVGGLIIVEHKLELLKPLELLELLKPLEPLEHLTSLSIHARLYAERTDYRG